MADSVNLVSQRISQSMTVYELSWEQEAASGPTTMTVDIEGAMGSSNASIMKVVTVPDSGDAPTDNYDIELLDFKGVDVFGGKVQDCDTSNTETWVPYYGSTLTIDPPSLPANHTDNPYQLHVYGLTTTTLEKGVILIWVAM